MTTSIDSSQPSDARRRRPWIALLSGVALDVGLSLLGDTPDTRDAPDLVARYFSLHRNSVFGAVIVVTAAMIGMLWTASDASERLSAGGRTRAARFAISLATIGVALFFVALLLPYATMSYFDTAGDNATTASLFKLSLAAIPLIGAIFGALFLTVGVAGRAIVSRWFAIASGTAGVLVCVSAFGYAARGPFSPDVQQQVVGGLTALWLIAYPFGVMRRGPRRVTSV